MYRVGIDLGGTNIAIGIVDENNQIIYKNDMRTEAQRGPEAITKDMATFTREVIANAGITLEDVQGVGIGSPGVIDPVQGVVVSSNNIRMAQFPMVERFRSYLDMPTYINNDANCAALGEQGAGAAKDKQNVVMITLGTGIGSGIIIDGQIFGGHSNAGAELGHTVMCVGGYPCTCGRNGCWEAYCSVTGLVRQVRDAVVAYPDSELARSVEGDPARVGGRTAFLAAGKGDETAQRVVDTYVQFLAEGLIDIINVFQPEVILVGGGLSNQGETLLAPVREYVRRYVFTQDLLPLPEIKRAALGNDAGIVGAAMLVR